MTLIILILLLSLVFIIGTLVYFGNKNTRKQKKMLSDEVQQIALQQHLAWDKIDLSRHRVLAWNTAKKLFVYCGIEQETALPHTIWLDEVQSCTLVETMVLEHEQDKKSTHKNVTAIGLQFHYKDKAKDSLTVGFYSEIMDGVMERNNQSQKAKEWLALIQNTAAPLKAQQL